MLVALGDPFLGLKIMLKLIQMNKIEVIFNMQQIWSNTGRRRIFAVSAKKPIKSR